jgi:hypothetical protein
VQTPVGARCRDCARIVRSPIYTLSGKYLAGGIAAAVVGALVLGNAWGWLALQVRGGFGFFSFFVGAGLGYVFTRLMEFSTNRKRGPLVVALAITALCGAWAIQFLYVGRIEVGGLIALGVGIYFARQNLR